MKETISFLIALMMIGIMIGGVFKGAFAYNQNQKQNKKPDPCKPYRTEMKTICDSGVTEVCLKLQIMYANCLTVNKILKPTRPKKKEKTIEIGPNFYSNPFTNLDPAVSK